MASSFMVLNNTLTIDGFTNRVGINWGATTMNPYTFTVLGTANMSTLYLGYPSTIGPDISSILVLSQNSAFKPATDTWTTTSDERVKKNIELANLDICYSSLKALPLKRFEWLISAGEDKRVLGFTASTIQEVLPKAVTQANLYGYPDFKIVNMDQIEMIHYGTTQKLIQMVETNQHQIELLVGNLKRAGYSVPEYLLADSINFPQVSINILSTFKTSNI
jgi:hypothetical protein